MPRTVLTKTLVPVEVGIVAGTAVTWTAADVGNLNQFPLTGTEIVIAWNTDGAGAHNVTITSVGDAKGRKGDITTDSVPTNGFKVYCRHSVDAWRQTVMRDHPELFETPKPAPQNENDGEPPAPIPAELSEQEA